MNERNELSCIEKKIKTAAESIAPPPFSTADYKGCRKEVKKVKTLIAAIVSICLILICGTLIFTSFQPNKVITDNSLRPINKGEFFDELKRENRNLALKIEQDDNIEIFVCYDGNEILRGRIIIKAEQSGSCSIDFSFENSEKDYEKKYSGQIAVGDNMIYYNYIENQKSYEAYAYIDGASYRLKICCDDEISFRRLIGNLF